MSTVNVKHQEGRPLSVGDALAVAALLLFILGWLVGWALCIGWAEQDDPGFVEDLGTWEAVFLGLLAWMPSMWAAKLAKSIVANAVPGKSWEWER